MRLIEYLISRVDDFGNFLIGEGDEKVYDSSSPNKNIISEARLARLVSKIDKEWAIITAYRYKDRQGNLLSKKDKIERNRRLRTKLNQRKMGVYQLVGHWQECQEPDTEYKDCPKNKLVDVIERSYMVPKPDIMDSNDFLNFLTALSREFEQDGFVYNDGKVIWIVEDHNNKFKIGTGISLNKIAQAYSQHVRKLNVPFVFEGVEIPGSISGRYVMRHHGLLW